MTRGMHQERSDLFSSSSSRNLIFTTLAMTWYDLGQTRLIFVLLETHMINTGPRAAYLPSEDVIFNSATAHEEVIMNRNFVAVVLGCRRQGLNLVVKAS